MNIFHFIFQKSRGRATRTNKNYNHYSKLSEEKIQYEQQKSETF